MCGAHKGAENGAYAGALTGLQEEASKLCQKKCRRHRNMQDFLHTGYQENEKSCQNVRFDWWIVALGLVVSGR